MIVKRLLDTVHRVWGWRTRKVLNNNFEGIQGVLTVLSLASWWQVAQTVQTTFSAQNTYTLLLGSVTFYRMLQSNIPIPLPDNRLTATVSTEGRLYELHFLLNCEGTKTDVLRFNPRKYYAASVNYPGTEGVDYESLATIDREVLARPGPQPDLAQASFYGASTAEPGDRLELWVCNTSSTNPITMAADSTVRIRPM